MINAIYEIIQKKPVIDRDEYCERGGAIGKNAPLVVKNKLKIKLLLLLRS